MMSCINILPQRVLDHHCRSVFYFTEEILTGIVLILISKITKNLMAIASTILITGSSGKRLSNMYSQYPHNSIPVKTRFMTGKNTTTNSIFSMLAIIMIMYPGILKGGIKNTDNRLFIFLG